MISAEQRHSTMMIEWSDSNWKSRAATSWSGDLR